METICKKKNRIKKNKVKDKILKLAIVFGPVLFLLLIYFVSAIVFDYNTEKTYSRLGYNEKVNGLINMVRGEKQITDTKPTDTKAYVEDTNE
jgi:hypothetical protein